MPKIKHTKHYVNSKELEEWWLGWCVTHCLVAWEETSERIFHICCGVATRFNPKTDEELQEHAHDAWFQVMEKIKSGKLRFTPGRAPVFNLVTTTVFRILYSKMNKQKKQRDHHKRYTVQHLQEHNPELLKEMRAMTAAGGGVDD